MPLQIRRGSDAERLAMSQPLAVGELLYVTDQARLYIGNGTTVGGVLVTGYNDNDAKDAAAAIFTSGSHTGGLSFTYNTTTNTINTTLDLSNYDGTLGGVAFQGNILSVDDSTILVNASTSTFNGDLSGSVLTAAQPNITSLGTLTSLAVTGAVTGSSFTGNVFTNVIDSSDSSSITVTPSAVFQSNVTVDNELNVTRLVIDGITHTSIGKDLYPTGQANEPEDHYLSFVDNILGRATVKVDGNLRYNPQSKSITANGFIGSLVSAPTINTTNILTSDIGSNGSMILYSNLSSGSTQYQVAVGDATRNGRFRTVTNVSWGAFSLAEFNQHHETADASNVQFNRSRGTLSSPTTVQISDDIADLAFGGYDGVAYRVKAAISAVVDGAVSTNVVPTKLVFATSATTSGPVDAVVINSNQQTTFNGAITLATYVDSTARNAAITAPVGGMMIYISGTGKFQGYNGLTSTWNDLN